MPVRLFYDFLVEEGVRESNPVGRGRYTPGRQFGGRRAALVPRMVKLPWIPAESEWLRRAGGVRREPIRNRVMLALAYDAALRREELCSLRTDDLDPGAPHAAGPGGDDQDPPGAGGAVLGADRGAAAELPAPPGTLSRARGPLFLSESRRNHAEPLTLVDLVEGGAPGRAGRRGAAVLHPYHPASVSDRSGPDGLGAARDRDLRRAPVSTESTLRYIHLSGRDLAGKLNRSMEQIHAWRVAMLTEKPDGADSCDDAG